MRLWVVLNQRVTVFGGYHTTAVTSSLAYAVAAYGLHVLKKRRVLLLAFVFAQAGNIQVRRVAQIQRVFKYVIIVIAGTTERGACRGIGGKESTRSNRTSPAIVMQ